MGVAQLLAQKQLGLLVKEAVAVEDVAQDVLAQPHPVLETLQVIGHAPAHGVRADLVLRGVVRHEQRRAAVIERGQVQLSGATAVHLPGEHVALEERHLAAGEDQHHLEAAGNSSPPPVQEA